jgi:hypothetical protein
VKSISENALLWAFRDINDFDAISPMYPYVNKQDCYIIYSMRRALPPPIHDPPIEDRSSGLYEEPSSHFSEDDVFNMCSKIINITLDRKFIPSVVSNKSTLECPRKVGGRDLVSSYFLRRWNVDILPDEINLNWACEPEIPSDYVDFLAIQQSHYRDFSKLFSIAVHIAETLKRPPMLGECIIKERGFKYRIPHIPEWHNQIIGSVLGDIGFRLVSYLCPNTFRQMHYHVRSRPSAERLLYSGDFKNATDNIPHDVACGAWDAILEKSGFDFETKIRMSDIIRKLICPHIIVPKETMDSYRVRFSFEADVEVDTLDIPEDDDVIIHDMKINVPNPVPKEAAYGKSSSIRLDGIFL